MIDYRHVTFMLSLPRSRSAWMAEFVRPGCALSLHNPLQQCGSVADLKQRIDCAPRGGPIFVSDVAGLYFFHRFVVAFPGAQYMVVHRPAHEVQHSMQKLGIQKSLLNIRRAEKQLLDVALELRMKEWAMCGTFFELNSPALLCAIYRFVTGKRADVNYVHNMMYRNVQVPLEAQMARTDFVKQRSLFAEAKIL